MDNNQGVSPLSSPFKSICYTFRNPYPQCFTVPYSIIKFMIKDPQSPKVWKKLLETCKYFYSKNHVLPVFNIYWLGNLTNVQCQADGEIIDYFIPPPKLWVFESLRALVPVSVVSSLIRKIYKFDLRYLTIAFQNLTLNDFQKLTASGTVENLVFEKNVIKNSDGTFVTVDKLLENLQRIVFFHVNISGSSLIFQADSSEKMAQHLYGFNKLIQFNLSGLSEAFDFIAFKDFLMTNKTVAVRFSFASLISRSYSEAVNNIIKEITANPALKVPEVKF